jgi:2-oxoglutarate dehydrogenase E2 component (dihydrolipoamide succinyltransferase)
MPKVQMPQLGESVAEGTIGKWLKQPGDHVDKYEPIVEVITDKVNAEVPSPFEGTLTQILVQEGETVPNNTEIAVIDAVGEGAQATSEAASPSGAATPEAPAAMSTAEALVDETAPEAAAPVGSYGAGSGPAGSDERPDRTFEQPTEQRPSPPASQPAPQAGSVSAVTSVASPTMPGMNGNGASTGNGAGTYSGPTTPAVKRLAREHGVDLAVIAGSGHGGRVTREDVLKFVESGGAEAAHAEAPQSQMPARTPASMTGPAGQSAPASPSAPASHAPVPPSAPSPVAHGDSLKQASPMRRSIATQMTRSLQVPVAYTVIEVDMSGVVALRDRNKAQYQAQEGISLTFDAFVAKATVEALKRHADFNAHYTDEGHWLRQSINLGVAVAVEDGLVVPVIKDADRLSIHGLNRKIRELADKSRANKLMLDDIQGGTFTLDNTGWTGSIITQPIINTPQVGILTMESIVKRPVVVETANGDLMGIKPMMYMCLGFDHRATDGAQAGKFVADVKRWLEAVDSTTAIW